jgi:hypothetical protein
VDRIASEIWRSDEVAAVDEADDGFVRKRNEKPSLNRRLSLCRALGPSRCVDVPGQWTRMDRRNADKKNKSKDLQSLDAEQRSASMR